MACLLWTQIAHGEIYKFVDDNGHVTYTNMPRPGAKKLDLGPSKDTKPVLEGKRARKSSTSSNPTPGTFPRVDSGTQSKRDDMRRQLLVEERSSEQRNLNAAQSEYASGRRQPGADINRLMDAVRLHEKNIEMLNKELSHIR
ncbi:MAG: DUF4124 domain-containing protein [Pseudomonadota bacterium]|nr:DUF4124 domain-containing protein [Pseudomonadota bacterium]